MSRNIKNIDIICTKEPINRRKRSLSKRLRKTQSPTEAPVIPDLACCQQSDTAATAASGEPYRDRALQRRRDGRQTVQRRQRRPRGVSLHHTHCERRRRRPWRWRRRRGRRRGRPPGRPGRAAPARRRRAGRGHARLQHSACSLRGGPAAAATSASRSRQRRGKTMLRERQRDQATCRAKLRSNHLTCP